MDDLIRKKKREAGGGKTVKNLLKCVHMGYAYNMCIHLQKNEHECSILCKHALYI